MSTQTPCPLRPDGAGVGLVRFHYVYILQSQRDSARFYLGQTAELKTHLLAHNRGGCDATAPFRPWRIKTAMAFTDEGKARDFERYLKSGSGRAFARKRL